MPTNPELARVKRAAASARRSREEYRRALVDAHTQGSTYADLARAAGISPQAARVIVERASCSQSDRSEE